MSSNEAEAASKAMVATVTHTSPCNSLTSFRTAVLSISASGALGLLAIAGYLWARMDTISVIATENAKNSAVLAMQVKTELSTLSRGQDLMAGKLDTLMTLKPCYEVRLPSSSSTVYPAPTERSVP